MQDTTRRWPVIAESDGEWHWQWTDELTDATESQRLGRRSAIAEWEEDYCEGRRHGDIWALVAVLF